MTKKWLRERKNDYYHRLATQEGYRSRAAYKLLQIDNKYPFLAEGDVIVDLGSAPGGWMQAARKLVGEKGYILGIDLKPLKNLGVTNVSALTGDIEKLSRDDVLSRLPRKPDAVLSDISPNVSGFWEIDHARQIYLSEVSLKLAVTLLSFRGSFLVKVFQGGSLRAFLDTVKGYFRTVTIVKPNASRMKSAELYILALDFNGKNA